MQRCTLRASPIDRQNCSWAAMLRVLCQLCMQSLLHAQLAARLHCDFLRMQMLTVLQQAGSFAATLRSLRKRMPWT
jgi:hypothetical protein